MCTATKTAAHRKKDVKIESKTGKKMKTHGERIADNLIALDLVDGLSRLKFVLKYFNRECGSENRRGKK